MNCGIKLHYSTASSDYCRQEVAKQKQWHNNQEFRDLNKAAHQMLGK